MRKQMFYVLMVLALLVSAFPTTTAFAEAEDGGFEFVGLIQSLPGTPGWIGDWLVSGTTVHVTAFTRIQQKHGAVAVGAAVEVKGWTQPDGSVNATKIEIKSSPDGGRGGGLHVKFYGFVQQLPPGGLVGTWMVSGTTVEVSPSTWINQEHGPVVLNAYVEVEGWRQPDGSVAATKIEVKSSPGGGGSGSTISFYGMVESFPPGFIGPWRVSGRTVNVDSFTIINQEHGPVAVGATVEVKGILQPDGSVNATKIEVKASAGGGGGTGYVKFYGIVEDLPAAGLIGDWMVSGRTVHVSAATRIKQKHGPVRIGATVEIKGLQLADGSVDAYKIEVKR